jgi:hypothetical protein
MKYLLLLGALHFSFLSSNAQEIGFPFGQFTYKDLEMSTYPKDTSAVAVVLKEFGDARFEDDHHDIIFKYHVRIKILKKGGLHLADFEIPLRKIDRNIETIRDLRAITFNVENGSVKQDKLDPKNQFTENINKHWDTKKFALPSVRVGSVIELEYELRSPFIMNFRTWEFQSEIPKVSSEFWASMPANYKYNITLRGFLKLDKNENEISRNCFGSGFGSADCLLLRLAMNNVPAFIDEDHMTARSNFLSAVTFELFEIQHFDGTRDKLSKNGKMLNRNCVWILVSACNSSVVAILWMKKLKS